jgi:hypothetical protein
MGAVWRLPAALCPGVIVKKSVCPFSILLTAVTASAVHVAKVKLASPAVLRKKPIAFTTALYQKVALQHDSFSIGAYSSWPQKCSFLDN